MGRKGEPLDRASDAVAFGALVRERREARGWSQEALAAEALLSSERKGYVSEVERGGRVIKPDTAKKFANALGIAVELIPKSLRWPEAVAVVSDTSAQLSEVHNRLITMTKMLEAIKEGQLDDQLRDATARELGIKADLVTKFFNDLGSEPPTSVDDLKTKFDELVSAAKASQGIADLARRMADSLNPEAGPVPLSYNDLIAAIQTMTERHAHHEAVGLAKAHLRLAEATGDRIDRLLYSIALADAYRLSGEHFFAGKLLDWVVAAVSGTSGDRDPITPVALNSLALLRFAQRETTEARHVLRRAYSISIMQVGPKDPRSIKLLNNYSNLFGGPP